MLERTHLAIIRAVYQTGTVTEAAQKLYLTQSALSHSIKKLEGSLGTAIWQKEGRNLRLTQAGLALLSLADRVLPQFEHSEQICRQIAEGKQGALRIGMECHPCYQWLLKIVTPFLKDYPAVDVDVRQAFQFGGLGALLDYEIDLLITPDPIFRHEINYLPVFEYEHVLAVSSQHPLANFQQVEPEQLSEETLITYPVDTNRLDVFSQFLTPAGASVKQHKVIETTEIMLQMVGAQRGVAALPRWLIEEYAPTLQLTPVRLGKQGIHKKIHLGLRSKDSQPAYLQHFIALAKNQR